MSTYTQSNTCRSTKARYTPCKGISSRQRVAPRQQPQQVRNQKMPCLVHRNPPRVAAADNSSSSVDHQGLNPPLGGYLVEGEHEKDRQRCGQGGAEADGM